MIYGEVERLTTRRDMRTDSFTDSANDKGMASLIDTMPSVEKDCEEMLRAGRLGLRDMLVITLLQLAPIGLNDAIIREILDDVWISPELRFPASSPSGAGNLASRFGFDGGMKDNLCEAWLK
jgi:hypothetical protein